VSESGVSTMSASAQRRALDRPVPGWKGAAFGDKVDVRLEEGPDGLRGLTSVPKSSSLREAPLAGSCADVGGLPWSVTTPGERTAPEGDGRWSAADGGGGDGGATAGAAGPGERGAPTTQGGAGDHGASDPSSTSGGGGGPPAEDAPSGGGGASADVEGGGSSRAACT
jgi:hypothetical protein